MKDHPMDQFKAVVAMMIFTALWATFKALVEGRL